MFPGISSRRGRTTTLAVAALAVLLLGADGAQAQQITTFAGSACQGSGSAQDLYYSDGSIANRTDAANSAVCPLARRNPIGGWLAIVVFVRDRHSTQNVTCVARSRDVFGTAGTGWQETRSSNGEGDQSLVFSPHGGTVPLYGPYSITCSLPAMEEVNQPSYISSYVLVEP
jgi:hypothetical protein